MRSGLLIGLMLAIGSLVGGAARGALTSAPSIDGSWAFKVSAGGEDIGGYCTFGVEDGHLVGTARMSSGGESFPLRDVAWDGTTVTFKSISDASGSPETYSISAKLKGDRLIGAVSPASGGSYDWTAKRVFDLIGAWSLSAQSGGKNATGVVTIDRTGGQLAGSVKIDGEPDSIALDEVKWDNGIVTFVAKMTQDGQTQTMNASGQLKGLTITGSFAQPDGSTIRWTATHAPELAGFWKFTVQSPDGPVTGDLLFEKKGGEWTGSARRHLTVESNPLKNIVWENGVLSFDAHVEQDGQTIALKCAAKFQSGKLSGVMTDPQGGSYPWSAMKDDGD
jgi:hypothetical protein